MSSNSEKKLDDELSSIIDESEGDDLGNQPGSGTVDAGIPPAIGDLDTDSDSEDESFSIDDFESEMKMADSNATPEVSADPVEDQKVEPEIEEKSSLIDNFPNGSVSEFREGLSELSRQVELDRLTFLHGKLTETGKKLPSLDEIASDIKGSNPMFPKGDCDVYDSRPSSRLDGWISGLSFGANRRAKRFHK